MRNVHVLLLVLAGWLAPCLTIAQSAYYWSDGRKISLQANPSAVMVHFETSEVDAPAIRAMANRPEVAALELFETRQRAVIHFTQARSESPAALARLLGFTPAQVRSVSYGWRLDDGFEVFHTHEVVLQLARGHQFSELQSLMNQYGASFLRQDYETLVLDVPSIDQVLPLANAIRESGKVRFAHPDLYAKIQHFADPLFGQQFQMHNTGQTIDGFSGTNDADANALEAWGITLGSSSITVAVIDDGVENHEDLDPTLAGYSPAGGSTNGRPNASGAHGQACAGIINANHNGIGVQGMAPGVNLITANIFVGGETGQDLANAITWAKNQGADVLSNSWGYGSCTLNIATLTNALNDANSTGRGGLGCVVVFASGNDYNSCVSYPADVPSVIAVGAFGNDGVKSDYSNAGPALDISAPSNDISSAGFLSGAGVRTTDRMGSAGYSSTNYTNTFGGTSAACPVVAGVAALVLSVDGTLTSTEVKDILYTTAKDFGATGRDNSYGWGGVDAFAACQAAGGGGTPPSGCSSTVSSFPYSESFESGLGAWTQASGDDFDWTRRSGGTPSGGTGPSAADDGSFYLYVEASSPNYPTKVTRLESPCYDLSGLSSPTFAFRYHMLGSNTGSLALQASPDGSSWTTVWTRSGSQGSAWLSASVDLSSYAGQSELRLRFVGTTGTNYQGDLCVDAITLSGGGTPPVGCTDTEVTLTLVLDNYPGETTWSLVSGSTTLASGGPYATAGATVTETFCLPDGCYDFVINDSYGDGICCAYGNGSYDLSDAGGSLATGGSFGTTETANFCVGGGGGPACPAIDFNAYSILAFGGQDIGNSFAVQDGGATLFLANNTWKYIPFNYTVTANTILEFDFRSTAQGEIHGVGFDTDNSISSNLTFQVHGTQNWGILNYNNYSGTGWLTYQIPVGNFFTGAFSRLTFVADHDGSPSNGTAYFRNVTVTEGPCPSSAMVMGTTATPMQLGEAGEWAFEVYPNPARDLLHLRYGQAEETYQVSITDAAGRVLRQRDLPGGEQTLDIAELSAGIYFLRMHGQTGDEVRKFVKQ